MTTQPKPNWSDIVALFDEMERACRSEQPEPDQPLWCWERERLALMLSAVMQHQMVRLGGINGEHKSTDLPHFEPILHGAIAALILNAASSFKLHLANGRPETDFQSAARLSLLIGRQISARLKSFDRDEGVSHQVETPKDGRPRVEPFDFRKHMSGAK